MPKKITLCKPNGFCAGVERAIKIVDLALEAYGAPIYVNHEIVHNQHVVADLASRGAVFVEDLDEVPEGARLIYSAHGVSPEVRAHAKSRKLRELDATCPLVTKVHLEALRFAKQGYHIFLIGHADHVEVIGTYGEVPEHITIVEPHRGEALDEVVAALPEPPSEKLVYLTQTTLNVADCMKVVEALKVRFPHLIGPPKDDICYATSNRQDAVKAIAPGVDHFIVVGSHTSSNSKRLVEVAREHGAASALYPDVTALKDLDLEPLHHVAITAGASTPNVLVQAIIDYLQRHGFETFQTYDHVEERMHFAVPAHFRRDLEAKGVVV
ncbi:4-hydroxy-3-methylbut-2-enyl diphosphate reductase [Acanthopleuribacter pedis]|uniref:4-hydroxy-3-methylbut-2-enyl diphosphate reductase n=1 Tax=Acanthopleuribacter pedis TaxID=442870 RepID=A0A8J7QH59_9BACT|nr:4-hydroxy-3-methylbut-2-enyl diphosphate reductase [Acanthopleuribacter pedis]MBO1320090.1 4-hydroxy-3-methylbut-2-enyl diphosphate reductase [Acanthopleuribacter pedis]